jgi:signal transduction histidine kinase
MGNLLRPFLDGSYAPHGFCLLWQPELVWSHVIADGLIAASYFSIPAALVVLTRRRRDLAFSWIFGLFALFILACGTTHLLAIWNLWNGNYGIEALVKIVTAAASVTTAAMLWPLLPRAIALPSPAALRAANADLAAMVVQRDAALAEMREQIAQRERAEAALLQAQKLEAVGQLTGGIAHDFNNLLQALGGNLELINSRPDDPAKVQRWSGNALRAIATGKSLAARLLAFSRTQRLSLDDVPLAALIEGMSELVERSLGPLSRLDVRPCPPDVTVRADAAQLELAILNLAINARDAMPGGGMFQIAVTLRALNAHPDVPPGDYVQIDVTDTGTGMPPEVLARAIEPFFTTKERGRGTGLGLSMVFGVVTQSGGAVSIESTPGDGTTVSLLLKRGADRAGAGVAAGAADARTGIDLDGRTIVLIDDDEQVRRALEEILTGHRAEVISAADGRRGLEQLQRRGADMMIVDFAMPEMNGAEVARHARSLLPTLPILIVTGYSETAKIDAIGGEALPVLRKPVDAAALLDTVGRLLGPRRALADA